MIRQLDEIKFHEPRPNYKNHHASPVASLDEEKEHTDTKVLYILCIFNNYTTFLKIR